MLTRSSPLGSEATTSLPLPARLPLAVGVAVGLAVLLHLREAMLDPLRATALWRIEAFSALWLAGSMLWVRRWPRSRIGVGIVATNVLSLAICAYHAWVGASLGSCALGLALLLAGAGLLFAWGFRRQMLASVGAALGFALLAWTAPGELTRGRLLLLSDLSAAITLLGLGAYLVGTRVKTDRALQTALESSQEELRRAREVAEQASRSKNEFLANMSHEMRTPMNVIFGMMDMALESDMPPGTREYLRRTRAAARNLLLLVNDVLDFSKMEAGKLGLQRRPFEVRRWLDETLEPLTWLAREKRVELSWQVDPAVDARLLGDPGRLAQVVVNLVTNGIKFTDAGGVTVRVRERQEAGTPADPSGCLLHFEVRDTGIGIAASHQTMIFDAFAQAATERTRHRGGTGLGLAICTRLVDLMDGRIWLESELERGSAFHFTVRLAREGAPNAEAEAVPDPGPARDVSLPV